MRLYLWIFSFFYCYFTSLKVLSDETKLFSERIIITNQVGTVNTSKAATVPCEPSLLCSQKDFYGFDMTKTAMMIVDNRRKILMEMVPKADCSGATVMFAQNMGFRYGIEYSGWPHHFRKRYLYPRCGRATACMMYDSSWYRFKVVRNPYAKVVSGFIHIMNSRIPLPSITPQQKLNLTFNQFIDLLAIQNETSLQTFGMGHCKLQSQPFERKFYGSPNNITIYHKIVPIENAQNILDQINQQIGSHFHIDHIHRAGVKKTSHERFYRGDIPWSLLKEQIPKDYGLFYSPRTQKLVERIFQWDFLLYRYDFPYNLSSIY